MSSVSLVYVRQSVGRPTESTVHLILHSFISIYIKISYCLFKPLFLLGVSFSLFAMHFSSLCSVGLATNLITTVISDPYVFDPLKKVTYQGFTASPGIESFLGIPYGQDTSGQNRFAPPQAFVPSTNYTFNATAAGPSCPQPSFAGFSWQSQIDYQSEDCLNLNVVRPARNASCYEKLPVMVYIYGGTF